MQTLRPVLVVSIHDVSPLTRERVSRMLADLDNAGLGPTSLLVIPNHHHQAPLLDDARFCEWLQSLKEAGHEIVLHGYFHQRTRAGGWQKTIVTEYYTAGEGEFFDLGEAEARELLENGLRDFAQAGFIPSGFVAPAWLLGDEAEQAVREADFSYTTRLRTFKDLTTGREHASQSLVWSVRSAWRRKVSLGWNAFLGFRLRTNPLLRIGLHPPDWDHPAVRGQILRLISSALAVREAMTYEVWLARWRVQ